MRQNHTQNITITDAEAQKALTAQSIEDAKAAAYLTINTENKDQAAGFLENNFDKDAVQKEINLQVDVSKEFSVNTQAAIADLDKAIKDKEKAGQDTTTLENTSRLLKVVAAGLAAPTDSVLGMAAAAASPEVAREIGQYFKENAELNKIDGGNRAEQGSAAHILAHTVLGAAVAATGGNDALTAGLAAGGAEAVAPVVSNWLYGTSNPEELTTEQKATISSIASLAGAGVGGINGGSVSDVVAGSQVAQNAVDNNFLTKTQVQLINLELVNCALLSNGECNRVDEILYEAKKKSSANIALVEKYMLEGNAKAIESLLDQAASSSEVNALIPRNYGPGNELPRRQDNVKIFESTKGMYTLFGSDADQAKESKEFRDAHCKGLTSTQCNTLTKSAWDVQYTKYYAAMAVSTLVGGVRPKSVPRLAQLPKNTVDSLKNKVVKPATVKPTKYNDTDGEMFYTNQVDFKAMGLSTKIHPGAQGKHMPQHNNYLPGKSPINSNINPQELLDGVHSGKYPIISKGSRGNVIVDFGKPIGVDNRTGLPTNLGAVHSGKNGAHIVPHNPTLIRMVK